MRITFPSNTRDVINAIREAIGRDITIVYSAGVTECPVCSLDPVNNTSTDPFCPVCSGNYWIPIESGLVKKAHVFWKSGQEVDWLPAGTVLDADVTAQIEYSGNMEEILDSTKYILVDGNKFELKKTIYRGVPEINRVILVLQEYESEED